YFTSVRELEQRLVMNEDWAKKPKPKVTVPPPRDIASAGDIIGRLKLLFDLSHLALQTDSTRLITLYVSYTGIIPEVPGVTNDWHSLSHHSKRPEAIEQLGIFETAMFKALHGLLGKLKTTRENNDTLLDRTMVLFGSNMNDGTTHSNRNLPIVLAGGGFKHGQHLGFDAQRNRPLCNLYVSMLQRLGLEIGSFGSSTGTLTGLEKL
ncbi:MAG: DUF1552 domain-containing protein, partial [Planctomycetes bacterium]|nr:DUF1552 domain-containing protein [Planctomycetota bacterium]